MREGRFCAILFQAVRNLLILKRRDAGAVDQARLESAFGEAHREAPKSSDCLVYRSGTFTRSARSARRPASGAVTF
jgi:hypothetical protein